MLLAQSSTFEKAKTKIVFFILIFSLVKILVAVGVAWHYKQTFQLERALAMLVVYAILMKIFLADKAYMMVVAHVMVALGLLLIWSNIFIYGQKINIITIQFIFMLILSSFYLLNARISILYALASTLPVIFYTVSGERISLSLIPPNELVSPGYEIIIVLNFITIVISHYLFQQAFVANIKEKEDLNVKLQTAVKEANQAAESKSDFLSTMSHELRTPLNSVIGISELLLHDTHSEEQEENLNILKFSAGNLHTLINDILDFNKLGSGKLVLESVPVYLDKLLGDLSMGLRFQAVQKGVELILDIDEQIKGRRIITDPTRITQIIYNLAGNAIKFTQEGSVTISLELLAHSEKNVQIEFAVADTGIGISSEQQEAIFEPFTQASSSITRNYGGTGLGLAIVKKLLVLFDSTIKVKSASGRGSRFSFQLNLLSDTEPESANFEDEETGFDLGGLKVLVAEDNPMNRLLLLKIFSKWDSEPVFAVNGKEAVEKVSSGDFDLVLMDLHMPVMDGYEATRSIRAMTQPSKSNIRIFALTASVSGNLDEKIKGVGMNDFLLKPFKLSELYKKIRQASLKSS